MPFNKTFEMAFIVGAALQANFATVMDKAQKKTDSLTRSVKALDQMTADVKGAIARRNATEAAKKAWVESAAQAEKFRQRLLGMSSPSERLVKEFERLNTVSIKSKQAWLEQKNALVAFENSAKTTGMTMGQLIAKQERFSKISGKANRGLERYREGRSMMGDSVGYASTAGLAVGAKMTSLIQTGAGFDSAMARVGAVSGASGEDLLALREQAKELGKSTVWSSSEAASGQQFLAMAGFSKDQILKSMPGMLDLASAGGIDLGSAADIGSNILTGMGLDASEMGRVGDVLVNTFTKSNTNLTMLGETMKYSAPVAKSLGVSIEEAAAMAGKLGDAGIQGSMAGTTLRAVMLRLSAPSKQGADALDALGVKTTDVAGNMRKIPDILADLNRAMAKMTDSQRSAYTKAIFDTEAMSGAFVLMKQAGSGALQEFIKNVKKSGSASEVARKQNDNLIGDYKALTSAAEGASIAFYENLEPALRKITQLGTEGLSWLGDAIKEYPNLSAAIGYTAGAIGLLATTALPVFTLFKTGSFIVGGLKAAFGAAQVGMAAFNVAASANPIGMIVMGIAAAIAAGYLLYENWDELKTGAEELWEGLKAAFGGVGEYVSGCFETAASGVKTPINAMIAMINSVIATINEYANVKVPSWVPGVGGESLGFQLNPIPALASGGVATRSTIAQIGEGSEPEAVLPLSRLNAMLSPEPAAPSVNVNLNISVNGSGNPGADIQQAASAAAFNLKRELERLLSDQRRLAY